MVLQVGCVAWRDFEFGMDFGSSNRFWGSSVMPSWKVGFFSACDRFIGNTPLDILGLRAGVGYVTADYAYESGCDGVSDCWA
jgi:hypothetical protein